MMIFVATITSVSDLRVLFGSIHTHTNLSMEEETISFAKLFHLYAWKEIANCPGRYVLRKKDNEQLKLVSPNELLNKQIPIDIFNSEMCPDQIHIGRFVDGGLLSYAKSDGTFVHTLNNPEGLNRKINHLRIILS